MASVGFVCLFVVWFFVVVMGYFGGFVVVFFIFLSHPPSGKQH